MIHETRRVAFFFAMILLGVGMLGAHSVDAYFFERDLSQGDSGEDVTMLQEIMHELGFLTQSATGFFGPLTEKAVQSYQGARGIVSAGTPQTTGFGKVGPATRAKLNEESGSQAPATAPATTVSPISITADVPVFTRDLSYGSEGSDVAQLQRFLNDNGYPVALTGPGSLGQETTRFFDATRTALAKFQVAESINPALGYFGALTRARVNEILAGKPQPSEGKPEPDMPDPVDEDDSDDSDKDDDRDNDSKSSSTKKSGFGTGGSTTIDRDAPTISNITYDTVADAVTIEWQTSEPATSAVDYGVTSSYGSTEDDDELVTSHTIEIDGLDEGETYHFRISSTDEFGNEVQSADQTFVSEDYFEISSIPGLVAFWDFSEDAGEDRVAKAGTGDYPLAEALSAVSVVEDGPFSGRSISLSGSNYLKLLSEDTGDLHIGPRGDEVTVVAWTKPTSGKFVAGMWKESSGDPRREYGLFYNLDTYGCSNNRVCGHISKTGDKSPGLPYSRDLSKSRITMATSTWNMIGMTYDGSEIISWHDGWWSEYTTYTEPTAPNGAGLTYPANPYAFDDGLYESTPSDFTVGANEVTAGMQNFFTGQIGGLAVYDRRLTDAEMVQLRKAGAPSEPVYNFNFTSDYTGNYFMAVYGWRSAQGPTAVNMSGNNADSSLRVSELSGLMYMNRGATTTPSLGYIDTLGGIDTDDLDSITFRLNSSVNTDQVRVAVKVDSAWYATNQTYSVTTSGYTGSNWATAELKTLNFDYTAANWRDLTFTAGSALSLATSTRSTDLPSGELTGLGIFVSTNTGTIRLDDIKVFAD